MKKNADLSNKDVSGYYNMITSLRGEKPVEAAVLDNLFLPNIDDTIARIEESMHYCTQNKIGEGSHSTVWLAQYFEESELHMSSQQVCIKEAKKGYEKNLIMEFNILNSIRHPAIIKPMDLFQEGGTIKMVLPYYSQSAYALKGQCDMLSVWRFCESVSGALEYLHDMGLVHNDVKLSNILVDNEGHFFLSDLSAVEMGSHFEVDDINFGHAIIQLITGMSSGLLFDEEKIINEIKDESVKRLIITCFSRAKLRRQEIPYFITPSHTEPDYIQWTAVDDFSIIQKGNKFGLMNRFHQIVIPAEFDYLTQVGLLRIPGPGPLPPAKMRCLFRKGDRYGSYLIDRDYAILELDITTKEWQERQQWT